MRIVRRWGRKEGRDKEGKQHVSATLLLQYTPADPKKIAKSTRQASESLIHLSKCGGHPRPLEVGELKSLSLTFRLGKKETFEL